MIDVYPESDLRRILGNNGDTAEVTTYNQLVAAIRRNDIVVRFEYNISPEDVTTTTSGTGAASHSTNVAVVSCGAGVGAAALKSIRNTVYVSGSEIFVLASALFSAGQDANTYQRIGIFDADDGLWFGYSGTSFGVASRTGTTDTFVAQSSWSEDKCDGTGPSGFTLDPTKLNLYRFNYGWFGGSPFVYSIYAGPDRGWIIVHIKNNSNVLTAPSMGSPNLPVTCEAGRTSGAGAVTISTASWAAGSTVGEHSHAGHRVFSGELTKTLTAGAETYIASFQNNATFQGKTNKVRAEAVYLGIATDGTKNALIRIYRNSTLAGTSYTSVDANSSVMSYDTAGSVSVNGKLEMSVPMAKVDTISIDLGAGHIHLEAFPGDVYAITGLSSAATDVLVSFRWEEYFA